MDSINELLERCRTATGPDREIDFAMARLQGWTLPRSCAGNLSRHARSVAPMTSVHHMPGKSFVSLPWDVLASSPMVQMIVPGQERIIVWRDCERCAGRGFISVDNWVEMHVEGLEPYKINMGSILKCHSCRHGGVVSHFYTRGVSLTPFIGRHR